MGGPRVAGGLRHDVGQGDPVQLGLLLHGPGTVWVDDFDLEVVWPSVKVTGQPTQPTARTRPLRQGLPLRPVNPAFEERAQTSDLSSPGPGAAPRPQTP
jgi:hypothetical protein